jgi:hypothetical protein
MEKEPAPKKYEPTPAYFFNRNVYIAEGRLGTEENFYGPCFGVLPYDRLLWIGRDTQHCAEVRYQQAI